jgi:hypothetical protein
LNLVITSDLVTYIRISVIQGGIFPSNSRQAVMRSVFTLIVFVLAAGPLCAGTRLPLFREDVATCWLQITRYSGVFLSILTLLASATLE